MTAAAYALPGPALEFVVPGEPRPKARPRTVRTPRGGVVTYTPRRTAGYEDLVRATALRAVRLSGWPAPRPEDRFAVDILLRFETSVRSDLDNVAKSVLDGMMLVVFLDDWQVSALRVRRVMSHPQPGAVVRVHCVDERVFANGGMAR